MNQMPEPEATGQDQLGHAAPPAAAPPAATTPAATPPTELPQPALPQPALHEPAGPAYAPHTFSGTSVPTALGDTPATTSEPPHQKQRSGQLVAGLVIGAVLGGIVGGGTAAVVSANAPSPQVQSGAANGAITLNNLDSATAVTGVAAVATQSVVTLEVQAGSTGGSGSGVIYSEDGYIITNAHVATLEGASANPTIQVQLSDGRLYSGTLVGSDPYADIAVVKIEAEGLTPISVADSSSVNVGDVAVAIGAPLNLSNTVTSGVVSALYRGISVASSMVEEQDEQPAPQEDQNGFPWFQFETPNGEGQSTQGTASRVAIPVIQTDASINPGNSGGALLNANGELIGINVALASTSTSEGTAGSDGLGFAVPAELATRVADALIDGEQPTHGQLGVLQSTQASTTNQAGGVIVEVNSGSAGEAAGLRAGDVITSVNGIRADSYTTVTALVRMHAGGSEITIGYNRNGENRETTVILDTLEW